MAFCFVGCQPPRETGEIIEDIITYHGCYGDKADEKVSALLDELNSVDSKQGGLWKNIMDYWDYANKDLKVNMNKLPSISQSKMTSLSLCSDLNSMTTEQ